MDLLGSLCIINRKATAAILTGTLFHGLQFESQQELKIENSVITWQVTMISVSFIMNELKIIKFMQACQRTCYVTEGCVAFQYSLDDSRHNIAHA